MEKTNEPVKVMWFSRHEMTPDQEAALGPNVEVEQVNKSINNVSEVKDEIARNDVIAIVAPINLQQQFLKEAGDKPVIMAVNDRVLVPQPDGEDKVEFRFNKWEQLDSIDIVKHDYIPDVGPEHAEAEPEKRSLDDIIADAMARAEASNAATEHETDINKNDIQVDG